MPSDRAQLQARLLALIQDPAADDAAIEDCYLRLVAPQAWAVAQSGFQSEGRGAVVFDMQGRTWREPGTGTIDTYYVPADQLPLDDGSDADVLIEVAVGTYDPRFEMVCVVVYDDRRSCSRFSWVDLAA